jgi:hypothetical protein
MMDYMVEGNHKIQDDSKLWNNIYEVVGEII